MVRECTRQRADNPFDVGDYSCLILRVSGGLQARVALVIGVRRIGFWRAPHWLVIGAQLRQGVAAVVLVACSLKNITCASLLGAPVHVWGMNGTL